MLPRTPRSGLSIKRTSHRALIRSQIINMECFLGVGFTVWAPWHRPCDSGAASSSECLASHLYISRSESQKESGCGSGAWSGYYCSNINTPPKTDPRSNKNNCHIMCYINGEHLPPLRCRATEGEQVRELVCVFPMICFCPRKHAQVWSQVPSDCAACPVHTSNCSSEESALSGPSV